MESGNNIQRGIVPGLRQWAVMALVFLAVSGGVAMSGYADENVKMPNVAGAFYPDDPVELKAMLLEYIKKAGGVSSVPQGSYVLISPHAGYIYSGPVAAYGYKALLGQSFDTVVVLAPSHFFPLSGYAIYPRGEFATPLGRISVDDSSIGRIWGSKSLDLGRFTRDVSFFEREHSLEVQLPFLQVALKPGFKIIPILLGQMSYAECEKLARLLMALKQSMAGKPLLVVVSTDLSHYRPYQEAVAVDKQTEIWVRDLDARSLYHGVEGVDWNVCGVKPTVVGMTYASMLGAKRADILKYANSGDTAGDKRQVVGYLSALISIPKESVSQKDSSVGVSELSLEEKKKLLEIAKQSVWAFANGQIYEPQTEASSGLNLKRGLFVTLTKRGQLRGCLGQFSSEQPLYKAVAVMARDSASQDHRFTAVTKSELSDIAYEISLLTQAQLIDDWKKVRLGTDGVIVRRGFSSGVFLPQVATETGWDLDTFLGQLCSQKAGLPWDAYKDPATEIYVFQADVFSQESLE